MDELFVFFFLDEGENIITPENLRLINSVEKELFFEPKYQASFCYTRFHRCIWPQSIIRLFDGSYQSFGSQFYDPDFDNVSHIIAEARNTDYLNEYCLVGTLNQDAEFTADSVIGAHTTLLFIFYGRPLPGYDSHLVDMDAQDEDVRTYQIDKVISILQPLSENGLGDMKVAYYSKHLEPKFISDVITSDTVYLLIGFAFMVVFVIIQTFSLFTAGLAVAAVCLSIPSTNLIYHFVFSQTYIGPFNIITLFYVLGITADDIFVFYDAWRESARFEFASLTCRVSFCYKRISFATTVTSAIGFLTMTSSPLVVIRSFGLFAAILVVLNLALLYSFLPIVVVVYHLNFEKYNCLCCCKNEKHVINYETITKKNQIKAGKQKPIGSVHIKTSSTKMDSWSHRLFSTTALIYRDLHVLPRIRHFLMICFEFQFRFVSNLIAGCVLLVTFSTLTVVFIVYASRLRQNEAQVRKLLVTSRAGQYNKLFLRKLFTLYNYAALTLSIISASAAAQGHKLRRLPGGV